MHEREIHSGDDDAEQIAVELRRFADVDEVIVILVAVARAVGKRHHVHVAAGAFAQMRAIGQRKGDVAAVVEIGPKRLRGEFVWLRSPVVIDIVEIRRVDAEERVGIPEADLQRRHLQVVDRAEVGVDPKEPASFPLVEGGRQQIVRGPIVARGQQPSVAHRADGGVAEQLDIVDDEEVGQRLAQRAELARNTRGDFNGFRRALLDRHAVGHDLEEAGAAQLHVARRRA